MIEVLRKRNELLKRLRTFFDARDFVEVETPILSKEVIPEIHISPFAVDSEKGFLQASPELHMKQLLCMQSGPIYQVTRAFRNEERGEYHREEFTMIEWYRPHDSMCSGIELLSELVAYLLELPAAKLTSYREAFKSVLGIDPHVASVEDLKLLTAEQIKMDQQQAFLLGNDRDEWLNYLLSTVVEPKLGETIPEVLYHYPASQAALAKKTLDDNGTLVAERFEIYVNGIELANGYHELTDAKELEARLRQVNQRRIEDDLPPLPMPNRLLKLMRAEGLPQSAGVALGFDRLVMLATGAKSIAEVIAFPEV